MEVKMVAEKELVVQLEEEFDVEVQVKLGGAGKDGGKIRGRDKDGAGCGGINKGGDQN